MMGKDKRVVRFGGALGMLFLGGVLCGCGDNPGETVLIGRTAESAASVFSEEETSGMSSKEETGQEVPGNGEQDFELPGNDGPKEECAKAPQQICVYVCGAVHNPGVVTLEAESRVEAALQAAGGFTQDADRNYVNLAAWVKDGAQIYFPTEEETKAFIAGGQISPGETGTNAVYPTVSDEENGKVNINTADRSLLCTLPGIGEARALDIITYRENNGVFRTTEDIMKVSGIKTSVYEKIKDRITVQ